MVLNVTEEQKKVIESQGYMVVEFKLWFRKIGNMLIDYARRVIDTWKAIISFLQEMAFKAFDNLKDLSERFALELKPYSERLEDIDFSERQKFPYVRSLGRKYQPNFCHRVIYHRCRDRC